jgi:hypothetical protein
LKRLACGVLVSSSRPLNITPLQYVAQHFGAEVIRHCKTRRVEGPKARAAYVDKVVGYIHRPVVYAITLTPAALDVVDPLTLMLDHSLM